MEKGILSLYRAGHSIRCLGLALLVFAPFSVQGVDILGIYKLARQGDPKWLAAIKEHKAALQTVTQARAGLLPTVSFDYEKLETTQDIISSDNAVFAVGKTRFPTDTYTLNLTQPLFNYSNIVRYRQSKSEREQADFKLKTAGQELIIRIADLYLKVLAAQDSVELTKRELDAVSRQLLLAQARRKSGLSRITDVHDARARKATVEANLIEARNKLDDARQALKEVTGKMPVRLAGLQKNINLVSPNPSDVQRWIDLALKNNPSLLERSQALLVAKHEIKRQKAGHLPTLELSARLNNRKTEGTLFGGGSEVQTSDIVLRFSVPIYQGGAVSSRAREAAYNHQKAMHELERRRRAVIRETRAAYFGVITSISKVRAFRQSVISQKKALEAKREGFRSGLFTSLAVLDAERDLYKARRDYAQARYDYILNTLRLKYASGHLSGRDIRLVNAWFAQ